MPSIKRCAAKASTLFAALMLTLYWPAPAHAQQNGAAFRGTGTIVSVTRKVEIPASWYLQSADGNRRQILQCGRVNSFAQYNTQEVEIEGTWYQTAGICIDKLTTVAELKAAEAKRLADEAKRAAERKAAENRPTLSMQQELALKHAPVIWLAEGEQWLPSSIEFYANHMKAVCDGKTVAENILSLQEDMLPPNRGAGRCHFVTRQPLSGPYDRPAFLRGQNPAQTSVPIYVIIYSGPHTFEMGNRPGFGPDGEWHVGVEGSFYAQYMTFYPYNYGKDICPSVAPRNVCGGIRVSMGNHVADWELMTIRFEQGKPVAVHVGAHGNDIPHTAYTFRAPAWTHNGIPPGPFWLQWEGDHPVVYSAAGSHGLYGWAGEHNYFTNPVGDRYVDSTSRGIKWETWKNVAWSSDPKYITLLHRYFGRWGNPHLGKNGCEESYVPGYSCSLLGIPNDEFQLNDGPELPNRERDMRYMN